MIRAAWPYLHGRDQASALENDTAIKHANGGENLLSKSFWPIDYENKCRIHFFLTFLYAKPF